MNRGEVQAACASRRAQQLQLQLQLQQEKLLVDRLRTTAHRIDAFDLEDEECAVNTKRAHMVSKGYIKGWADTKGIVEVIDIQGRRGLRQAIGNATVVNYVYEPAVLTSDLEAAHGQIESDGLPVIVKLRNGGATLTSADVVAMIAFIDMHLDRGRYADQAKVRTPAVLVKTGMQLEDAGLSLGDRLLLSQSLPDALRLATLALMRWPWRVVQTQGLPTGDGAVLLWGRTKGAKICTVTFPMSPTRLLVIGEELPDGVPLLSRLTANCKRWIIGAPGTLNLNWADNGRDATT